MTEGGEDREDRFHHVPGFSDSLLTEIFSREVFALLLGEEIVSQALVEKISRWRHSGFSVHSKVKASTSEEAERVGKYMIRPVLSLERLSFDEKEGKVQYRHGKEGEDRLSGTLDGRRGRLLVCAALLVFFIWIVLYPRKVLLNPVRVVSPSGEIRTVSLRNPPRYRLRQTSYYELILNLGKGSGVQTELNPYLLIIDF